MTKTFSLGLAATTLAIIVFAGFAFAAVPVSPEGYWALNENGGAVANDSSGNGNTGAISGGATYTTSGIPTTPGNVSALTFDGVDDFVTVPNNATLDVTSPYSLAAWVNVTDVATYRPILFRGTTNADDIEVYVQSGTGDLIVAHNRGNGTNVQAYYDGVAAGVAQGAATVDAPLATGKPWMMGKVDHTAFGGTFLFSGLLDEVVIYDRVLTAAEIAALEALGTTLYVDDDGVVGFDGSCDGTEAIAYTTIQAAVNAASAGNTVNVCPGIYDEQVVIDGKDLTLQGAGDTTVISPSSASQLSSVYTTGTQTGAFFNGIAIATLNLREQADSQSRILGWIGTGAYVRIVGQAFSPQGYLYFQVQTPNGKTGWVYSRWVLNTPV